MSRGDQESINGGLVGKTTSKQAKKKKDTKTSSSSSSSSAAAAASSSSSSGKETTTISKLQSQVIPLIHLFTHAANTCLSLILTSTTAHHPPLTSLPIDSAVIGNPRSLTHPNNLRQFTHSLNQPTPSTHLIKTHSYPPFHPISSHPRVEPSRKRCPLHTL